MKRTITTAAALLTAATMAGCGGGATAATDAPIATKSSSSPPQPRLWRAATNCGANAHVQDEGKSITLDTLGEDDAGDSDTVSMDMIGCVLAGLHTPDYVLDHMDATRALDGMQTDQWEGVMARWTYHPDNGFNLTLVDQRFHASASPAT